MTSSARISQTGGIAATCAILGLATAGIAAAPKPAHAWWNHYGWGVGVYVSPPIVVAPPPVYYPPAPAYYPPPTRAWIPAHWENGYWVPAHWS